MNVHSISTDRQGGVVYWDADPVRKDIFDSAIQDEGLGRILPRRMKRATALRLAMSDYLVAQRQSRKREKYDLNPLDRRVLGFEAVLQSKGDEQNLHSYQWTAKVNVADESVRATSGGIPLGESVDYDLTCRYRNHLLYYCGSTAGSLLKRAVVEMGGTGLKGRGGVYFLPDTALEKYHRIDGRIVASGSACALHTIVFPIGKDDRTTRSVIGGFRDEVQSLLNELNGDLLGDTEMRENGIDSRISRLSAAREKVTSYQELFGVALDDLSQAVEATTAAIQMARLAKVSA